MEWSSFAYTQYATSSIYLYNSVMIFETLHRLGSKVDRLLMYPSYLKPSERGDRANDADSRLLRKARDKYGVKLQPVEVQWKTCTSH